jgi:hypothetical protein
MSVLSDQFADFPDFVDYRQDQLMEVLQAVRTLGTLRSDDPNHIISTISSLDPPRLHRMYQNKCNELRRGNHSLVTVLRNVSFNRFRAVMGADDYV